MKNIKKIYGIIGVLFLVFLIFPFVKTVQADITLWKYTDGNVLPKTYSGFETKEVCNENRDVFINDFPLYKSTTTECVSYISSGHPTVGTPYVFTPQTGGNITNSNTYKLLAPLGKDYKEVETNNIGKYFNIFFNLAIGLAGAIAVIMLVIGGVQWMGSESFFGKTEAKKRITSAILGLLIALGSYALLNTINPDLLGKNGLKIAQVSVKLVGDANVPTFINMASLSGLGIKCDKQGISSLPIVVKSFDGKMTYSQNIPKGQLGPNNTVKYDCSGFVNAALQCSGINTTSLGINSGTKDIFSNIKAETVNKNTITPTSINGRVLQVGDLIGWKPSDDKKGNGHVMIYIGNGLVADSHGPADVTGKAYGQFPLDIYKDRITSIVRTQSL